MDKEKLHQILSSLWKNDNSVCKTYYNQALQDVQTAIDLQEEPASEGLEVAAHRCYESNETFMDGFKKGAKWKKQIDSLPISEDLELTWEDMHIIAIIEDKLIHELCLNDQSLPQTQEFYEEVLKRFKAQKGE